MHEANIILREVYELALGALKNANAAIEAGNVTVAAGYTAEIGGMAYHASAATCAIVRLTLAIDEENMGDDIHVHLPQLRAMNSVALYSQYLAAALYDKFDATMSMQMHKNVEFMSVVLKTELAEALEFMMGSGFTLTHGEAPRPN